MTQPIALIIEDDPNLSRICKAALERAGFETVLDTLGDRYTKILSETEPALILLDWHLPFASGDQVLAELRANPKWTKIPVLIVTADLYRAKEMKEQGENVLVKPVSPSNLVDIVNQIMEQSKGSQQ
jgi:two-component system phosphate regulon response regulator PhoB